MNIELLTRTVRLYELEVKFVMVELGSKGMFGM